MRRADVLEALARGGRAVVLEVLSGGVPSRERTAKQSSLHGVYLQEEQSPGRKIPADLEVFGEKEYFYKKKDAQ